MFAIRRPNSATLEKLFESQAAAQLSYPEIGATAGELPSGYNHDRLTTTIGKGQSTFDKAADHLDAWGLQRSVGFDIYPEHSKVADGETTLLTIPMGPAFFVAATRVIYRVNEPYSRGFAYGTLPSHPEVGEEYFGVSIDETETVTFEVIAFSKPGSLLAQLGGPITRHVQHRALQAYLRAMERL